MDDLKKRWVENARANGCPEAESEQCWHEAVENDGVGTKPESPNHCCEDMKLAVDPNMWDCLIFDNRDNSYKLKVRGSLEIEHCPFCGKDLSEPHSATEEPFRLELSKDDWGMIVVVLDGESSRYVHRSEERYGSTWALHAEAMAEADLAEAKSLSDLSEKIRKQLDL